MPGAGSVYLGELQRGQIRAVRLPLMEIAGTGKRPSDFLLDVKVSCDVPGRIFYLDVRADFGSWSPRAARLILLKSRYDATTPLGLMDGDQSVERGVPLEIDPDTEKVIFWITAERWLGSPVKLAAELRVRPPAPALPDSMGDLDTMRLPSIKSSILDSLRRGLAGAPPGPMALFAEIMASPQPVTAVRDVGRLIEAGADIRLVEAAVRAIETTEQAGRVKEPLDFAALSVNDRSEAAVIVFHPLAPSYLVNQAFVLSLENHLTRPMTDPTAAFWKQLTKAAVIVLGRRDRAILEEDVEMMEVSGDRARVRVLKMLIEWARHRANPPEPPPLESLDATVDRMLKGDPDEAMRALCDALVTFGFIGVSTQLE